MFARDEYHKQQPQPEKEKGDEGRVSTYANEAASHKYSRGTVTKGNVISKGYNHDRFTLYTSHNVMPQPFWKRQPLFFGWTDSNDRRENVWMLVSSICIPSLLCWVGACS